MLSTLIILLAFLAIVISLASSFYFLMTDRGQTQRTVRALTYRVGFSALLFVGLLLAFALGLIEPHGLQR